MSRVTALARSEMALTSHSDGGRRGPPRTPSEPTDQEERDAAVAFDALSDVLEPLRELAEAL